MKRVKRLFACLLALTMMLGLSATAFAEQAETKPTDQTTVKIKKVYKLVGKGTSPAETFTLEQVGDGRVTDGDATVVVPPLKAITGAEFKEGAATGNGAIGEITVTLPAYNKVGVYEYTLKETPGKTAGVEYYEGNITLVVTVVNAEEKGKFHVESVAVHKGDASSVKSDTFENTYSAGTLNVSKTVTGNLGDKDKYFEFKVTLIGDNKKSYGESYAVTGGSNTSNPKTIEIGKETTFFLKDDERISIANLPYGVTYAVTETPEEGYKTKVNKTEGNTVTGQEINKSEQNVAFENNKNKESGEIDTGVYLDNLPYILVFAGVLAIAVVFAVRRRRFED